MLILLQTQICAPHHFSLTSNCLFYSDSVEGESLCVATLQPWAANMLSESSEYRLAFAVKKAAVSLQY